MPENCPVCGSEPGDVTYSLAPNHAACVDGECPVVSWRTDREWGAAGDDTRPRPITWQERGAFWTGALVGALSGGLLAVVIL